MKILSVDDSRTIRLVVARTFRNHDCVILEAANGEEGLAVAEREHPDLILLDVTMPIMDGVTLLTRLKDEPELQAIPVIMLTAESGQENVSYLTRLGARDYVVKPFKEEELVEKVGRVVNLQKRQPAAPGVVSVQPAAGL